MPIRVQLSRRKGWRMPPNTVSVARPGRWGNPFFVAIVGRERAVSMFRELMRGFFSGPALADLSDEQFATVYAAKTKFEKRIGALYLRSSARYELAGKNLACWCPLPAEGEQDLCHAAVLLDVANDPR
jgi:Domain of unknown function (DUF4326)